MGDYYNIPDPCNHGSLDYRHKLYVIPARVLILATSARLHTVSAIISRSVITWVQVIVCPPARNVLIRLVIALRVKIIDKQEII